MIPTGWELIALLAVLVLLFGASKLPTAARSIGQSMRIFKAETKGMRSDDDAEPDAPRQASPPPAPPAAQQAQPPQHPQPPQQALPPSESPVATPVEDTQRRRDTSR